MSDQNTTEWDDGSGDVVADLKAAVKKLQTETPKLSLVCAVECSPSDANAIRRVSEISTTMTTLAALASIRVIENAKLRPGYAIGRDANNNVIGWLNADGWHWLPLPGRFATEADDAKT